MPFLLDTCAFSELAARRQNRHAVEAILGLTEDWFIAAATVGEVRRGIDELEEGKKRRHLEAWFEEHVCGLYIHKIIVFDLEEATAWGTLVAALRRKGLAVNVVDSMIAATALVHGLTVVTRNEADFAPCGVKIFNPWK